MAAQKRSAEQPEKPDEALGDLRLIYSTSTEEIRFLKTQQWSITNYVALSFGVVVAVWKVLEDRQAGGILDFERLILSVLATVAMAAGLWSIGLIDKDLTKNRDRIVRVNDGLTTAFKDALDLKKLEPSQEPSRGISNALKGVIIIGWLIVLYLLVCG